MGGALRSAPVASDYAVSTMGTEAAVPQFLSFPMSSVPVFPLRFRMAGALDQPLFLVEGDDISKKHKECSDLFD